MANSTMLQINTGEYHRAWEQQLLDSGTRCLYVRPSVTPRNEPPQPPPPPLSSLPINIESRNLIGDSPFVARHIDLQP